MQDCNGYTQLKPSRMKLMPPVLLHKGMRLMLLYTVTSSIPCDVRTHYMTARIVYNYYEQR